MTQTLRLKSPRWLAFVLLGMVLFCCGGSFTTLMVSRYSSERSLHEKLKQLSAKGIPVDDASVEALHETLTSKENVDVWIGILDKLASQNFTNACQNVPIVGSNENPIPKIGDPWSDEALVEQFLSQNADTMKQLLAVAQDNGHVRYPIEFKSLGTPLPHLDHTYRAARVLMLEAILAARAGDADREFRAINAMIGCAISIRGEPIFICQVASIDIHQRAISRLQSAMEANRLEAEQLAIFRTRLAAFSDISYSYTVGLKGEIGLAIPAYRDPREYSPQVSKASKIIVRSGMADRLAHKYAERMEATLEIPTDDLQHFIADCEVWDSQFESGGMIQQLEGSVIEYFAPNLASVASSMVRCKMLNDLATLAIAARQYEIANGQLPKSLEELKSQGIDLSLFHCLDGNLPLYLLFDSAKPEIPTSPSIDSSAPVESSKPSRAILWSFNPEKTTNNPNPSLSPTPPAKTDNQVDPAGETDLNWWRWDLQ